MVLAFASMATATLSTTEMSTKTVGATTITWESSFHDLGYTLDDTVTMTVDWVVDAGAASYGSFVLKHYTPKSKKDPAAGTPLEVTYPGSSGANSVDVSFEFIKLHLDKERNVDIGNAHLKLWLDVDQDGDGVPETLAGFGVNVHVEDPR